jgi:multiple sugar transport system permease protein
MKEVKLKKLKKYQSPVTGYLFISPWLLGFLLLTFWPIATSFYYSFTDFNLLNTGRPNFIGFANYAKIIVSDTDFRQSLLVTLHYVFLSVPVKLIAALIVAMILNQKIKGIGIYRTFFYMPTLIGGSVAVAILWRNIWGPTGFINQILGFFGAETKSWISTPEMAIYTLILLGVWQFGSSMIVFLAGLKQIPADLYEATAIDGANRPTQFFRITMPMLSSQVLFNLVLQTISAFQIFTQAYIITNKGGPMNATRFYALYLFHRGFLRFEMGYAATLAWIMLAIIALVTVFIFTSSRFWVFYQSENV